MKLLYSNQAGASHEFELTGKPITVGRSSDADIILLDDKVSRRHFIIRGADGAFFIKDLDSKNGTFVNGERVETARLLPSDVIKAGNYSFSFEQPEGLGAQTALREISDEMSAGKGYATLLKQIVDDSDAPAAKQTDAPLAPPPVKMPETIKAPPKISLTAQPEENNIAAAPGSGSLADAPPASTPPPAPGQPLKSPVVPALKKPLAPARPKILLRPPGKPGSPAPASSPGEPSPPAGPAPAAAETDKQTAVPPAPAKTVIRKPTRPVIRLNMNKKV